jgi:hypothetical protein
MRPKPPTTRPRPPTQLWTSPPLPPDHRSFRLRFWLSQSMTTIADSMALVLLLWSPVLACPRTPHSVHCGLLMHLLQPYIICGPTPPCTPAPTAATAVLAAPSAAQNTSTSPPADPANPQTSSHPALSSGGEPCRGSSNDDFHTHPRITQPLGSLH